MTGVKKEKEMALPINKCLCGSTPHYFKGVWIHTLTCYYCMKRSTVMTDEPDDVAKVWNLENPKIPKYTQLTFDF